MKYNQAARLLRHARTITVTCIWNCLLSLHSPRVCTPQVLRYNDAEAEKNLGCFQMKEIQGPENGLQATSETAAANGQRKANKFDEGQYF
jgi:hypothetical protein